MCASRRVSADREEALSQDRPRVVVTGVGAVTPLAHNAEDSWRFLVKGEHAVRPVKRFDVSAYPVGHACEVQDYEPDTRIDRKSLRRMAIQSKFALGASLEAADMAGIEGRV